MPLSTSKFTRLRMVPALLLLMGTALVLSSCAPVMHLDRGMRGGGIPGAGIAADSPAGMRMTAGKASADREPDIVLQMHDRSTVTFSAEQWELTTTGVRGHATITPREGRAFEADTTLSYWDVSSAAAGSGRGTLVSQFLLTVLGVILVLGLAAIVLYAAFLATNR